MGTRKGVHRAVDSRLKFSTCRFCGSLDLKSPFEDVVSIPAFMMLSRCVLEKHCLTRFGESGAFCRSILSLVTHIRVILG